MGMQQISDRVRTGPTQVLRAFFAGIGRILLTADRPDGRPTSASRGGGEDYDPQSGRSQATQAAARWRDLDKTGNVRLLSAEDMAREFGVERTERSGTAGPAPSAKPYGSGAALTDVMSGNGVPRASGHEEPAPGAQTGTIAAKLPLADYEQLSLPSIRARLRGLDVAQLRVLAEYERTHAERPEVLGMFERRIEKLAAGG